MIFVNALLTESPALSMHRYERDRRAVQAAQRLYEHTCSQGRLSRLWRRLTRRSHRLLDLATIEAAGNIHARHYRGMQTVLIEQIRGSEGRSADFDALFYPRQEHNQARWVSVAAARLMGLALPPVKLTQVGDGYFVLDGHHRISVARALGEEYIEAEVTVWQVSGLLPWKRPVSTGLPQLTTI